MILCENCSPRKQCMEDKNRTECKYYQPITEQEYIQTCNTEQLAEFIAQYFYGWTTNSTPYDIVLHSVREWLKQPHRDEIRSDDMKCPICDGTGEVANYHKIDFDEPTEPMTNEEWFSGLPTTKKSEFMAKMVNEAIEVHEKHGATWHESTIWWDGWLKQPHN